MTSAMPAIAEKSLTPIKLSQSNDGTVNGGHSGGAPPPLPERGAATGSTTRSGRRFSGGGGGAGISAACVAAAGMTGGTGAGTTGGAGVGTTGGAGVETRRGAGVGTTGAGGGSGRAVRRSSPSCCASLVINSSWLATVRSSMRRSARVRLERTRLTMGSTNGNASNKIAQNSTNLLVADSYLIGHFFPEAFSTKGYGAGGRECRFHQNVLQRLVFHRKDV